MCYVMEKTELNAKSEVNSYSIITIRPSHDSWLADGIASLLRLNSQTSPAILLSSRFLPLHLFDSFWLIHLRKYRSSRIFRSHPQGQHFSGSEPFNLNTTLLFAQQCHDDMQCTITSCISSDDGWQSMTLQSMMDWDTVLLWLYQHTVALC